MSSLNNSTTISNSQRHSDLNNIRWKIDHLNEQQLHNSLLRWFMSEVSFSKSRLHVRHRLFMTPTRLVWRGACCTSRRDSFFSWKTSERALIRSSRSSRTFNASVVRQISFGFTFFRNNFYCLHNAVIEQTFRTEKQLARTEHSRRFLFPNSLDSFINFTVCYSLRNRIAPVMVRNGSGVIGVLRKSIFRPEAWTIPSLTQHPKCNGNYLFILLAASLFFLG